MDPEETARAFGLGVPLADPTLAGSGLMGTVWHLRTDLGEFAVKEVWDPPQEAEAATADGVARELIGPGVPAPRPLQTTHGTALARLGSATVRVSEWVELREVDWATELESVGRLLALLHREPIPATSPVAPVDIPAGMRRRVIALVPAMP